MLPTCYSLDGVRETSSSLLPMLIFSAEAQSMSVRSFHAQSSFVSLLSEQFVIVHSSRLLAWQYDLQWWQITRCDRLSVLSDISRYVCTDVVVIKPGVQRRAGCPLRVAPWTATRACDSLSVSQAVDFASNFCCCKVSIMSELVWKRLSNAVRIFTFVRYSYSNL